MFIGLDFDGTVVDHRYPEIGEPVPGAIKKFEAMRAMLVRMAIID